MSSRAAALSPKTFKVFRLGKRRWQGRSVERTSDTGKRCREAKAADIDADGDIDICTKPWRGRLHFYLRNLLVEESDMAN
jgi:hypothetical protein